MARWLVYDPERPDAGAIVEASAAQTAMAEAVEPEHVERFAVRLATDADVERMKPAPRPVGRWCSDCFRPVLPRGMRDRCCCSDPIHQEVPGRRPARTTLHASAESVETCTGPCGRVWRGVPAEAPRPFVCIDWPGVGRGE